MNPPLMRTGRLSAWVGESASRTVVTSVSFHSNRPA